MRPKPIKDEDISKVVAVALGRGVVAPSKHVRERMRERNFDMNDAIAVLEKPDRIRPRWNDKAECWNYDFRGRDVDGGELTIRIAPTDDETGIVLVTGF
jgi:hypothetical protein